ncbi:MAG: hypothetical protein ACI835_000840 [Planctomycetota bacterium]|jgi:hypothetical protein
MVICMRVTVSRSSFSALWLICACSCGADSEATSSAASATPEAVDWTESDDPQIVASQDPGIGAQKVQPQRDNRLWFQLTDHDSGSWGPLLARIQFFPAVTEDKGTVRPYRPRTFLEPSNQKRMAHAADVLTCAINSSGEAVFHNVPTGLQARIEVIREGWVEIRQSDDDGSLEAASLKARAGQRFDLVGTLNASFEVSHDTRTGYAFELAELQDVSGVVIDAAGEGIASLEVWIGLPAPGEVGLTNRICPRDMDRFAVVFTRDDGSFSVRNLPPEAWLIGIPQSVANARRSRRVFPVAQFVSLNKFTKKSVTIEASVGGKLRGSAVDQVGLPAGGVDLRLKVKGLASELRLSTDSDGNFEFKPAPPASFQILAQRPEGAGFTPVTAWIEPIEDITGWIELQEVCVDPPTDERTQIPR